MTAARNSQVNPTRPVHSKITLKPKAATRNCIQCELPFFSRSTANAVCPVCKAKSHFDGDT